MGDSSNDGMSELFMSPFSKFLLFNKNKKPPVEEIEEQSLTDSARLALQMKKVVSEGSGRRGSGNKATMAGLISANLDENDVDGTAAVMLMADGSSKVPTTLAKIANLKPDANTADLVAVINAMKHHIIQLEQRVSELDGITVHQRKLRIVNRESATECAHLIANHHELSVHLLIGIMLNQGPELTKKTRF